MTDLPDFIRAAIKAQGKFDPDEVAARAVAVAESGVLDAPEPAEPLQTTIEAGPSREAPSGGDGPVLDDLGIPLTLDDLADPDVAKLVGPGGETVAEIHGLDARPTDPPESHAAAADVEAREGPTGVIRPGTHKHAILRVYGGAERPLTDTEAWTQAGIGARSGAWHRCSDLLDAGMIHRVGTVDDAETGKAVRTCAITTTGRSALVRLDAGRAVDVAR